MSATGIDYFFSPERFKQLQWAARLALVSAALDKRSGDEVALLKAIRDAVGLPGALEVRARFAARKIEEVVQSIMRPAPVALRRLPSRTVEAIMWRNVQPRAASTPGAMGEMYRGVMAEMEGRLAERREEEKAAVSMPAHRKIQSVQLNRELEMQFGPLLADQRNLSQLWQNAISMRYIYVRTYERICRDVLSREVVEQLLELYVQKVCSTKNFHALLEETIGRLLKKEREKVLARLGQILRPEPAGEREEPPRFVERGPLGSAFSHPPFDTDESSYEFLRQIGRVKYQCVHLYRSLSWREKRLAEQLLRAFCLIDLLRIPFPQALRFVTDVGGIPDSAIKGLVKKLHLPGSAVSSPPVEQKEIIEALTKVPYFQEKGLFLFFLNYLKSCRKALHSPDTAKVVDWLIQVGEQLEREPIELRTLLERSFTPASLRHYFRRSDQENKRLFCSTACTIGPPEFFIFSRLATEQAFLAFLKRGAALDLSRVPRGDRQFWNLCNEALGLVEAHTLTWEQARWRFFNCAVLRQVYPNTDDVQAAKKAEGALQDRLP